MKNEIVSIRLLCTNRDIPSQLRIGELRQIVKAEGTSIQLSNVMRPTLQLTPMLDKTQYWTTVSNLAQNYKSLLEPDALRQMLFSYNFPAMHNKQAERSALKAFSGILSIESHQAERKIANGLIIRGVESHLYVKQSAFNSEGELYLFGAVLARFFSQHATLNSFHLLTLINMDNQERYTWPVKVGQHSLI